MLPTIGTSFAEIIFIHRGVRPDQIGIFQQIGEVELPEITSFLWIQTSLNLPGIILVVQGVGPIFRVDVRQVEILI